MRRSEVVRVGLLGGFSVSAGSRTIAQNDWRLRKAATLVKLLALAPGHRMHREQAMEILWPDSGRRTASNRLRSTLHAARKVLDPEGGSLYLASEDESLVLCPEGDLWVDVDAFEEAVKTALRSREPTAYKAALDLYVGELLPTDRYEDWSESRRQELRRTHLDLLVGLARLHEEHGEYEAAIEALRNVVTEEPTREESHAGLMRLYALAGSKGDALAQYGWLAEIFLKELGTEPDASSRALREEIAAGRFPPENALPRGSLREEPPATSRHNLPAPRTSFVGREREMVEIKRELAMTRLLTLTGTGGSGKTRLALEVARDLVGAHPDGVWLVELAPLSEGALVPQAVARTLVVQEQPGQPLTNTLAETLRAKRMLLILDNCEHLVDACAHVVDALLDSCLHLRVLATSREPLRVEGEAIWPVSSLSAPDTDRLPAPWELTRYDAVRLFVDRAQLRLPSFELTPENGRAVAQVCERVEGIPLAIELATARVGAVGVEDVTHRLEDSLDLLSAGPRTAAPRQRTMRATLEWSHGLLSKPERELFERLSVFAGGWTLEGAEAVGAGDGIEESQVLDLLSRLVDKSLVVAETTVGGRVRYRVLEPVRQYAREKLEESEEAESVRCRHAAFFLALAQEAEPGLSGAQQRASLERLEAEQDNLRAALSWSVEEEPETALRLALALARFWEIRSNYSEGRRWLETVLRQSRRAEAAMRAKTLTEAGTFAFYQVDYERAAVHHGEALALYQELGDDHGVAFALNCLAVQEMEQGNYELAVPVYEEALEISRKLGDKQTSAFILHNLGEVERYRGRYGQAVTLCTESLSMFRELEDTSYVARSLAFLGTIETYHNDYEAAAKLLREGLPLARQLRNGECAAICLEGMALLAGARAEGARVAQLYGAADTLRDAAGAPLPPVERPYHERNRAAARSQLGEVAWAQAWAEGKAMTLEEAVEYALAAEETAVSTASEQEALIGMQRPNLTRREREVASLLARGFTNRQIAQELVVSEHTVENHVARILKKLNLHSREKVAARIAEQ